jgi:two-component system invasion response regulator UvrY
VTKPAKGYITMKEQPARFLDAIKTVANGGRYLHPEMAHRIAFLRLDQSPDAVSNLSTRELEILRLMAAGRTIAQIADPLNVSYKTIANNVTDLKRKLGATSGIDLMRMALSIREPKQLEVSKSSIRKRVDRNQARR